jgi:hypothetical protein
VAEIKAELAAAERASIQSGGAPARRFKGFRWITRNYWSRRCDVVAKAEWTGGEANPRFVVTSLTRREVKARQLYEDLYCARGEMENRIKECQLYLHADRPPTATMPANQWRLWFASMTYVLMGALRRIGLPNAALADATCGTLRAKFLKVSALVRISVPRVAVAMASGCPAAAVWASAARRLLDSRPHQAPSEPDASRRHGPGRPSYQRPPTRQVSSPWRAGCRETCGLCPKFPSFNCIYVTACIDSYLIDVPRPLLRHEPFLHIVKDTLGVAIFGASVATTSASYRY